ncbi:MAG: hypothetical protein H6713_40865 [Myxococcales bacterium]|nr:hypothetical protein [Myxococcales bacterium]
MPPVPAEDEDDDEVAAVVVLAEAPAVVASLSLSVDAYLRHGAQLTSAPATSPRPTMMLTGRRLSCMASRDAGV